MPQPVRFFDVVTLLAIFLGPVFAVLVSLWRERTKAEKERRVEIFRTLMATRATGLLAEHVRALNLIDVEFYGQRKVRSAWKSYLDHLNLPLAPTEEGASRWEEKRRDLFAVLLSEMSSTLGYDFDDSEIKNLTYRPKFHGDVEQIQLLTMKNWQEITAGTRSLHVVFHPPAPPTQATAATPQTAGPALPSETQRS